MHRRCKTVGAFKSKQLQSEALFTCPVLANRGKVLILLARSAYFALLCRLNAPLVLHLRCIQKRSCNYGESIKSKICSQSSRRCAQNKYVQAQIKDLCLYILALPYLLLRGQNKFTLSSFYLYLQPKKSKENQECTFKTSFQINTRNEVCR